MRIVAIGDIHGKDVWKKIVEQEKEADKIIFVGDYVDSFTHTDKEIWDNLMEIVAFKLAHPEQVVLLLGNHDYHYLPYVGSKYSGYRESMQDDLGVLFERAIEDGLIHVAWQGEDHLFTHAGLTKTFCVNHGIDPLDENLAYRLNELFDKRFDAFSFAEGTGDNSGEDPQQGPLWVRPQSLTSDSVRMWQVVGHTKFRHIYYPAGIIFIDCLDSVSEYLVIRDTSREIASVE